MRSYAQAKHVLDSAKKKTDVKMTPAIRLVMEVEALALKRTRQT